MRAVDLADLRTEGAQLVDGGIERRQHARLIALAGSQLFDHADAYAGEITTRADSGRAHDIGDRDVQGGGVARVMAGDHRVQQGGVSHCPRAGPALIQRRCARHQAVPGDGAVGGFNPDRRGQRGWLAD